ncbi:transmembrane protein, putative (macronuclear) [Tetrahymena thermophila SB210]|uniref:Transmembrane protein, putative n=1 Tax=Tetrahymena thermophila (strain SB210) TaxID=312017 RepID=A4VEQ6_TETTS|nr:transmembrane protein, putative [Tetrahymena thermophila SB210]EDK32032.2 transmembrane protein, putative [Tetrahymena thermophila SB210]|eukprot:XP_001471126.2 transmembrane protein, putative [Tetrahymena thermophila SB210]
MLQVLNYSYLTDRLLKIQSMQSCPNKLKRCVMSINMLDQINQKKQESLAKFNNHLYNLIDNIMISTAIKQNNDKINQLINTNINKKLSKYHRLQNKLIQNQIYQCKFTFLYYVLQMIFQLQIHSKKLFPQNLKQIILINQKQKHIYYHQSINELFIFQFILEIFLIFLVWAMDAALFIDKLIPSFYLDCFMNGY